MQGLLTLVSNTTNSPGLPYAKQSDDQHVYVAATRVDFGGCGPSTTGYTQTASHDTLHCKSRIVNMTCSLSFWLQMSEPTMHMDIWIWIITGQFIIKEQVTLISLHI